MLNCLALKHMSEKDYLGRNDQQSTLGLDMLYMRIYNMLFFSLSLSNKKCICFEDLKNY